MGKRLLPKDTLEPESFGSNELLREFHTTTVETWLARFISENGQNDNVAKISVFPLGTEDMESWSDCTSGYFQMENNVRSCRLSV